MSPKKKKNLTASTPPGKSPSPSQRKEKPAWLIQKLQKEGYYQGRRSSESSAGFVPTVPLPTETELTGEVVRVIYRNSENGYGVALLRRADGGEDACLVGMIPGLAEGLELSVTGSWNDHPKFGRQFAVESSSTLLPRTAEGIRRYLSSSNFEGINDITAAAIVKAFGDKTIEVLDKTPERLREVPGIGEKRYQAIADAWQAASADREELIFLGGLGLSEAAARKVIKKYAPESASQVIRANPYRLAHDIDGFGFLTADKIAMGLEIKTDSDLRIAAGYVHVLTLASQSGDVLLPKSRLVQEAAKILGVPEEVLERGYQQALLSHNLMALQYPDESEPLCYLPSLAFDERDLAALVNAHLLNAFPEFRQLAVPPQLPGDTVLNPEQTLAVETALGGALTIITGGPGVGKTTVIQRIVAIADANHWKTLLAAPTGRAAKRMSQAVKTREAMTIHRLLKFNPLSGSFDMNSESPLDCDLLVVDEVSMLDLSLAKCLFEAIPPKTRVVLVGDRDQLPSVGPGAVLHDLIACERIPVVQLKRIYRQKDGSRIIGSAHDVNEGRIPDLTNPPKGVPGEFYFYETNDPQASQDFLAKLCAVNIPEFFGLSALSDVQVLTPMRKGECGTNALNIRLQAELNPPSPDKPELTLRGSDQSRIFRLGDRVMQIQNNYEKGVFNGDMGRIVVVNLALQEFTIAFDKLTVDYKAKDCGQLVHAYAVTIHKSQGSEFPAVVVPLLSQHYVMLQRNLLYTAITRAKKLFILVGSRWAIQRAIENDTPLTRLTKLTWRLRNPLAHPVLVNPPKNNQPELFVGKP